MISSGDTYKSIGKVLLVLGVIGALALKFAKDDMEEFKWVFILGAPLVLAIDHRIRTVLLLREPANVLRVYQSQ